MLQHELWKHARREASHKIPLNLWLHTGNVPRRFIATQTRAMVARDREGWGNGDLPCHLKAHVLKSWSPCGAVVRGLWGVAQRGLWEPDLLFLCFCLVIKAVALLCGPTQCANLANGSSWWGCPSRDLNLKNQNKPHSQNQSLFTF